MRRYVFILLFAALGGWAQNRQPQWVVVMNSPSVARRVTGERVAGQRITAQRAAANRDSLRSAAARNAERQIQAEHGPVRAEIANRGARYLGESTTLLNAIYFQGSSEDAASLRGLPGVQAVVRMRMYKRLADDQAANLVNAAAAWDAVGGVGNAGAGRRIGIIDSGIDQTHPAFQDDSLTPPSGFPRASEDAYLSYTSKKVIVARSYVEFLVDGDHPDNSRPDDVTPTDRGGHGTAVAMLAAGLRLNGPAATITGIAPKAFLGNYKVFGSPGVNDFTTVQVVVNALTDAINDGMDVVTLSLGAPADWGPLDMCGSSDCDPLAAAIEEVVQDFFLAVVTAAGNDGDLGSSTPTLGTINSPGTAPSAITVGAITNGQIYYQSARIVGNNVPSNLQRINGRFGNGPIPAQPLTAPLIDVTTISDDGTACRPLGNNTLNGAIALIRRGGNCGRADKVTYAQRAGAVGILLTQFDGDQTVPPLDGLQGTGIPLMLIGSNDGQAVKSYLQQNTGAQITLDRALTSVSSSPNQIAYFSSRGPSIGEFGLKPELTAVGTDLYVAAQQLDPNGELFSPDRFTATQGTSFAVPLVAGAAALVKQKNPDWDGYDLKSAVVNTANPSLDDAGSQARAIATGAGKLDAAKALTLTATADPTTVAFGPYGGTAITQDLFMYNRSSGSLTLTASIQPRDTDSSASVTITTANPITIQSGQNNGFRLRLSGPRSAPGSYEGIIQVTGGGNTLNVPYSYFVGDGNPANIYPLVGSGFIATPGASYDYDSNPLEIKVVDRFGVPVVGANVVWTVVSGSGRIDVADQQTDSYGVATAGVTLGGELGEQAFRVTVGGVNTIVAGRTILKPTIDGGGVVNAASGTAGQGLQPGSYISIYGAGLSEVRQVFSTPYLPLAMSNVSVSFDVPAQRLSVPGRLHFITSNQINVQIPWELAGQNSVQMKVSIGGISSSLFTLPLQPFSPGIFEYDDSGSGRRLAAALDVDSKLVSGSNPVARGRALVLFVNGLGAVSSTPPSGEAAPLDRHVTTTSQPTVTIGGRPAQVAFSGLAPGLIGCYQVNVTVPDDAPTGIQPLILSIGGFTSQASSVPIAN